LLGFEDSQGNLVFVRQVVGENIFPVAELVQYNVAHIASTMFGRDFHIQHGFGFEICLHLRLFIKAESAFVAGAGAVLKPELGLRLVLSMSKLADENKTQEKKSRFRKHTFAGHNLRIVKQLWRETLALLQKDIRLEIRQKYALSGLMLYLASTVLVCYLSFSLRNDTLPPPAWNALFWIMLLFSAFNAVAKSFLQERPGRLLYYYTLTSPEALIFSKILYNALLMLVLALVGYGFYSLLLGNPVADGWLFLGNLCMGAVGFSSSLTLISGIASKAGNNPVLMAVLGFPVVLPMLLLLMKVSHNAMDGLDRSTSFDELLTLLALNGIVWALSFLLFPFLWRS
jgi:heme exporter protein B